jgi:hypothetical protein
MARDILSGFGPDSPSNQKPRATSGGVTEAKPLPYDPPMGPIGIGHKGVGLGGDNYGNTGTQGKSSNRAEEGGSPGIGGNNRGMGTNRS